MVALRTSLFVSESNEVNQIKEFLLNENRLTLIFWNQCHLKCFNFIVKLLVFHKPNLLFQYLLDLNKKDIFLHGRNFVNISERRYLVRVLSACIFMAIKRFHIKKHSNYLKFY